MNSAWPDLEIITGMIRDLLRVKDGPVLVAIDGRSGSGKSTLAREVVRRSGGVVIEGDDFYSGGSGEAWLRQPVDVRMSKCIDWRRLRREVLEPLLAGRAASWRPFDFAKGVGLAERVMTREPVGLIVLDGAYSARPELRDLIDLAVLVDVPADAVRRERLLRREGVEFMTQWHAIWDDAEDFYFRVMSPRESFDLVVMG
jgi:para-aminobenzoate synthetase